MSQNPINRRHFLLSALGAALATLPLSSRTGFAADAKVSESDPLASALGYKHDASKVDSKKFPQLAKPELKGQNCASCALFTPGAGGLGSCAIIKTGLVTAKGMCASWVKKA